MFRKNQFRIKGFTLIEVLVVLSIIAVIVASQYRPWRLRSKVPSLDNQRTN